jgi:hypothetical protein
MALIYFLLAVGFGYWWFMTGPLLLSLFFILLAAVAGGLSLAAERRARDNDLADAGLLHYTVVAYYVAILLLLYFLGYPGLQVERWFLLFPLALHLWVGWMARWKYSGSSAGKVF